MPLDFQPDGHIYRYNGNVVPSVTQIIRDVGLQPPYPEDRGWLEFGTAVHKCCELLLLDRLDLATTSPVLIPYVNGFAEKVREMRIKPLAMEKRVYHVGEGYAGTLDLHCVVFDNDDSVIDFKTGAPPESTGLQLALYDLALNYDRDGGIARKRYAFYLQPDRCIVKPYTDPYDYTAGIAAVRLWKWKYRNGRKP